MIPKAEAPGILVDTVLAPWLPAAVAVALALALGLILPAHLGFALGIALSCAIGLGVAALRRHTIARLPGGIRHGDC